MNWLKNLTGKDIAVIVTSVGGILLAGFLVYFNQINTQSALKLSGNHIDHNTAALVELSSAINGVREVQKETKEVIRANTDLLKNIFNKK